MSTVLSSPEEFEELVNRPGESPQLTTSVSAASELPAVAERLLAMPGVAFADLFGVDERQKHGCFRLHLVWALDRVNR
jgi:hypothetical protein